MDNPYQASGSGAYEAEGSSGNVSPGVMQALGATKPWVRFCSVLGFIGTAFLVIAAFAMLALGGAAGFAGSSSELGAAGALAGALPVVLCIIYLVVAGLYLFPSIKLWKYGTHIMNLMNSQSMEDLEAALDAQRSFWKFVGIMLCVVIGCYLVILLFAMVAAVAL